MGDWGFEFHAKGVPVIDAGAIGRDHGQIVFEGKLRSGERREGVKTKKRYPYTFSIFFI